ncbi:hypothetical protein [Bremerella alba]|uniref:Lipoprotein n=1 Tax=Bremerella alba TaxID=980252 RepID=A0A7V8V8I0_9BACT|nr:hypothetical protein [Bremerella alba]MBA2116634.1 hypothetical protein [Bremerella alba]
MLIRFLLFVLVVAVVGCSSSEVPPPPEALSRDQFVATLDEVAKTGQFEEQTLLQLTIGLEEAGLMGEAASVQQIASLGNDRQIKQHAKRLSASVKKGLAAGGAP